MKQKRYSEEQIVYALRQAESGEKVVDICRRMGISEQTFYACAGGKSKVEAAGSGSDAGQAHTAGSIGKKT